MSLLYYSLTHSSTQFKQHVKSTFCVSGILAYPGDTETVIGRKEITGTNFSKMPLVRIPVFEYNNLYMREEGL